MRRPVVKIVGYPNRDGIVYVGDNRKRELPWGLDVMVHSPDGFEWGYCGSGPAQLALAILLYAMRGRDDGKQKAIELHHAFMREVIAPLDRNDGWAMTEDRVHLWLDEIWHPQPRAPEVVYAARDGAF